MAKPKKIFVVKGSEDGIIGVYGNAGSAVDKALEYVLSDSDLAIEELTETRAKYITKCNKDWFAFVEKECNAPDGSWLGAGDCSAEIEVFNLNK